MTNPVSLIALQAAHATFLTSDLAASLLKKEAVANQGWSCANAQDGGLASLKDEGFVPSVNKLC